MVKVSLEDKDFADRKPYFDAGSHEVYITGAKKVNPEKGAPYIEVSVLGEGDATENIRVYISEAAAPYTLANLGRIAVHNKTTEAEKQGVRDAFKALTDTDLIDQKFLDKFKDMQAWILTEEDTNAPKPNGGYYLRSSLYSFEPKPRKTTVEDLTKGGEPTDVSEIPF